MITVHSDAHERHEGSRELYGGELVPCFERPERAAAILERVRARELGEVVLPESFGTAPLERVHSPEFLRFLEHAWDRWRDAHGETEALPTSWPVRSLGQRRPETIDGELGYFSLDASTPITAGTWIAARASADCALTAERIVASGAASAFALCRPPGHHAARDLYGGYCFLNNAAIAAEQFVHDGGRVAIVDIDYHHGNGTQSIFYERSDVLYVSVHGDPRQEYPYFLGYDDETGAGAGVGCNRNFPLAWDTPADVWLQALAEALREVETFEPDALVVSLGVDAYERDPISRFRLASDDFTRVGQSLRRAALPTLFVLEGGYAVDAIGDNVVNVLAGFEAG